MAPSPSRWRRHVGNPGNFTKAGTLQAIAAQPNTEKDIRNARIRQKA
jgi:hypothetical protein